MAATQMPILAPRGRRAGGCCAPLAQPDLSADAAAALTTVVKALADATRLRIVDSLRASAPEALCQCELLPLFDMSQPALSKHLKVLVSAGLIASERRGLWTYYYLVPDATKELRTWLS